MFGANVAQKKSVDQRLAVMQGLVPVQLSFKLSRHLG